MKRKIIKKFTEVSENNNSNNNNGEDKSVCLINYCNR